MVFKKTLFLVFILVLLAIIESKSIDNQYTLRRRLLTGSIPSAGTPPLTSNVDPFEQNTEHVDSVTNKPHLRKTHKTYPKKVISQIIRKYRLDQPDGSILWGYENDDGSFKEEKIGIDCITRGKYGYVDPDGKKREFAYETGIKCDPEKNKKSITVDSVKN